MNKEEAKEWREGFEMGRIDVLKDKEIEIEIGEAILKALDKRYKIEILED